MVNPDSLVAPSGGSASSVTALIRPSSTSISTSLATRPSQARSACHRPDPFIASAVHRNVDAAFVRNVDRALVPGVGVSHDAGAGVIGEHALELSRSLIGAVRDDDHAGVYGATDPNSAAVVNAHP